jgi:hypothetical protein
MNEHDPRNERLERLLDAALGDDATPDSGPTVWHAVRERTADRPSRGWIQRFATAAAAAACLTVGFMAGTRLIPGAAQESNWLLPDDVVAGSMWDETSWSIDGLYSAVETSGDADGGER